MSYEKVFSSNNNDIMNSNDTLLGLNDYSDNPVLYSNFQQRDSLRGTDLRGNDNMSQEGISFNFDQLPSAYFAENKASKLLRKQLVKREIARTDMNPNSDNGGIGILEKYFFSDENAELINKQLILRVYEKSNKQFLIANQKKEDLLIVMRYVFIEYGRNLPYDVKGQIKDLNCRVVSEILPNVMTNADQKIGYLRDINTQPVGPPLPISTGRVERTLPSMSNIIHFK